MSFTVYKIANDCREYTESTDFKQFRNDVYQKDQNQIKCMCMYTGDKYLILR